MNVFRGGLAVLLGLVTAEKAPAAPVLTEFDAPGAGTVNSSACAPGCGTLAYGTNASGAVVGTYTTPDIVPYAFVRSPAGVFTSFEAKGAGLGHGLNEGSVAYAINDRGEIAGQYEDASLVYHGYVRKPDGRITRFDAPNAGTGANQGTLAYTISNLGTAAGVAIDASFVSHGFVRTQGGIAVFDPPGSTNTFVFYNSINNSGTVAGLYFDANQVRHGYLRAADGTIISPIDCPGAGTSPGQGTFIEGINNAGATAGFIIAEGNVGVGFVRTPGGSCAEFSVPWAGPGGTFGVSIDSAGAVTGFTYDGNGATQGFVRYPNGSVARFNPPDAGGAAGQGTIPWSDHGPHGGVSGSFSDKNGLNHGFTWMK